MQRRPVIYAAAALLIAAAGLLLLPHFRDGKQGGAGKPSSPEEHGNSASHTPARPAADRRARISQQDQERVAQVIELMVTLVTMDSLADFHDISDADLAHLQQLVAAGNFQGALDFADTLEDPQAKGHAAAAVIHGWAVQDPDAALANLTESHFQPEAQPTVVASFFGAVASTCGASAKPLIREALANLPGAMSASLLEETAKTWINTGDLSPRELTEWWRDARAAQPALDQARLPEALALSGHGSADLLKYGFLVEKDVSRIVTDGLAAAGDLASAPPPAKPSPTAADEAINLNLYATALGSISGTSQGAKTSLAQADGLPAAIQPAYLEGIGKSRAADEPETASAWLASAGDARQVAAFWKGYVDAASDPRPLSEAITLFSRPGLSAELRTAAAAEIVSRKYQQDAEGTRQIISQLPEGEPRQIFQAALAAQSPATGAKP